MPATELLPGTRFTTGSTVVTAAAARMLVDLCGYTHPLFAGDGPPRMVPGQIVLALAAGLLESSGRIGDDVIALVGIDRVRFQAPLAPGDPVVVDVEVLDRRPTSADDRELVELSLHIRSGDRAIATGRSTFLFARTTGTPTGARPRPSRGGAP
jgi:acyl dehydratase